MFPSDDEERSFLEAFEPATGKTLWRHERDAAARSRFDAKSGTLVFQDRLAARGPCYASRVGGNGKLVAASARGEVTLFAAEDKLRVLSTVDLGERLMATPALSDGVVYVRTETKLRAFGAPDAR